jgi:hypothetical protein
MVSAPGDRVRWRSIVKIWLRKDRKSGLGWHFREGSVTFMSSLFCYVNTLISYQEHVDETISHFYPSRINCASCSLLMLVAAFFGQGIFFYPMLSLYR